MARPAPYDPFNLPDGYSGPDPFSSDGGQGPNPYYQWLLALKNYLDLQDQYSNSAANLAPDPYMDLERYRVDASRGNFNSFYAQGGSPEEQGGIQPLAVLTQAVRSKFLLPYLLPMSNLVNNMDVEKMQTGGSVLPFFPAGMRMDSLNNTASNVPGGGGGQFIMDNLFQNLPYFTVPKNQAFEDPTWGHRMPALRSGTFEHGGKVNGEEEFKKKKGKKIYVLGYEAPATSRTPKEFEKDGLDVTFTAEFNRAGKKALGKLYDNIEYIPVRKGQIKDKLKNIPKGADIMFMDHADDIMFGERGDDFVDMVSKKSPNVCIGGTCYGDISTLGDKLKASSPDTFWVLDQDQWTGFDTTKSGLESLVSANPQDRPAPLSNFTRELSPMGPYLHPDAQLFATNYVRRNAPGLGYQYGDLDTPEAFDLVSALVMNRDIMGPNPDPNIKQYPLGGLIPYFNPSAIQGMANQLFNPNLPPVQGDPSSPGMFSGNPLQPMFGAYKRLPIAGFAEGGIVPYEMLQPIQTEKREKLIHLDGAITDVNATKLHKQMDKGETTDIVPAGTFVASNSKKIKMSKKEAEKITIGVRSQPYEEVRKGKIPEEITLADIFPKKGNPKYTPAQLAQLVKKNIPTIKRDVEDVFNKITNQENLESRLPYLQPIIALNMEKRSHPPQYKLGGAVGRYIDWGAIVDAALGVGAGIAGLFGGKSQAKAVSKEVDKQRKANEALGLNLERLAQYSGLAGITSLLSAPNPYTKPPQLTDRFLRMAGRDARTPRGIIEAAGAPTFSIGDILATVGPRQATPIIANLSSEQMRQRNMAALDAYFKDRDLSQRIYELRNNVWNDQEMATYGHNVNKGMFEADRTLGIGSQLQGLMGNLANIRTNKYQTDLELGLQKAYTKGSGARGLAAGLSGMQGVGSQLYNATRPTPGTPAGAQSGVGLNMGHVNQAFPQYGVYAPYSGTSGYQGSFGPLNYPSGPAANAQLYNSVGLNDQAIRNALGLGGM